MFLHKSFAKHTTKVVWYSNDMAQSGIKYFFFNFFTTFGKRDVSRVACGKMAGIKLNIKDIKLLILFGELSKDLR